MNSYTYSICSPVWFTREAPDPILALETYYNDIYKLFLKKLANLDCNAEASEKEKGHLVRLFEELIKVKTLIQEERSGRE